MPALADLHMHTYYSDGTSSPEEVVADALKAGLAWLTRLPNLFRRRNANR